jgi:hypothetical protein
MSYETLLDFIDKKMRMSHIYQPVMQSCAYAARTIRQYCFSDSSYAGGVCGALGGESRFQVNRDRQGCGGECTEDCAS